MKLTTSIISIKKSNYEIRILSLGGLKYELQNFHHSRIKEYTNF